MLNIFWLLNVSYSSVLMCETEWTVLNRQPETEYNGVEFCLCVIILIFSFSLDQQQVQQMLGHLADPPARQWLPAQQAPQWDRGTHNLPNLYLYTQCSGQIFKLPISVIIEVTNWRKDRTVTTFQTIKNSVGMFGLVGKQQPSKHHKVYHSVMFTDWKERMQSKTHWGWWPY